MKICSKCKIEKDESEFYIDKRKKGNLGCLRRACCKICEYISHKKYANTDIGRKNKSNSDKKFRATEKGKIIQDRYKKSTEEVILKQKCRVITNSLILKGTIKKLPCEVCGELKVQAHHRDYSKPEDVTFLCVKHHRELHKNHPVDNC